MLSKQKTCELLDILDSTYPDAECALNHENIFQLIVAVALSAQTTDNSVNKVTPNLFKKYPTPKLLMNADQKDVEELLRTIGMYRTKSKNIIALGRAITMEHDGKVPDKYEDLVKLPGVGRKTANVVLSVGFGQPAIAVDTHVFRLANRMGIVKEKDVLKTEIGLMKKIPKERWSKAHHSLIFHGRSICFARNPDCEHCPVEEICLKRL